MVLSKKIFIHSLLVLVSVAAVAGSAFGYPLAKDRARWEREGRAEKQKVAERRCRVAFMYWDGTGFPKDRAKALEIFKEAADDGSKEAKEFLARYKEQNAREMKKRTADSDEEFSWVGAVIVMLFILCRLAYNKLCYNRWFSRSWYGGWTRNDDAYDSARKKEILKMLRRCRKSDGRVLGVCQNRLGAAYLEGYGVDEDFERAVFWFEAAAKSGSVEAMTNLGMMYEDGFGVERDHSLALYWYGLAADKDFGPAQEALDELLKKQGE